MEKAWEYLFSAPPQADGGPKGWALRKRCVVTGIPPFSRWTQWVGLAKAMPLLGFASLMFFFFTQAGVNSNAYKRKNPPHFRVKGIAFAVWTGLEPATPCVTGRYSNQLNYQTVYSAIADCRNSGIRITCVSQSDYKSKSFFEFCKDFLSEISWFCRFINSVSLITYGLVAVLCN